VSPTPHIPYRAPDTSVERTLNAGMVTSMRSTRVRDATRLGGWHADREHLQLQ
jgi:hypothetical protein